MTDGNIYASVLLDQLKTPIRTNQKAWKILGDIGLLVINLAGKVDRLDEKVYGNGKTGMADQLRDLSEQVFAMNTMLKKITPIIEKAKLLEDKESDSDWFRVAVRYFVDKILPALLISVIVYWATFQFALAMFMESMP